MDPEVDVILRKMLPNNKWTYQRFKRIKLQVDKDIVKRNVWVLVIGRTPQKAKIQITCNIRALFYNFLDSDGKVTVSFKSPPIECHMRLTSPTASNKRLLKLLLKNLQNTSDGNDFPRGVKQKIEMPVESHHAVWRSLRAQLSLAIQYTSCLDLSGRGLVSLPVQVGDLLLKELRLDDNLLGQGPRFWPWLYGRIRFSLSLLSLDRNKIAKLPLQIVACQTLHTLSLAGNNIRFLPPTLLSPIKSRLRELRLNDNKSIFAFPHPTITLDKLNLVGCDALVHFREKRLLRAPLSRDCESLAEIAGRVIHEKRISYGMDNMPRTLTEFLDYSMHCDVCQKLVPKVKFTSQFPNSPKARFVESSEHDPEIFFMGHLCGRCWVNLKRWRGINLNED